MNYFYFAALVGNRLVALVCLVILSYLLAPAAFGVYALAATNALLTEIVLGQWIATSATKYVALGGQEPDRATISTIAAAVACYAALMALVALAYAAFPIAQTPPGIVAMVLAWSAALLVYDATLASKNALGQGGSYALLALYRNFGSSALSIALVLLGQGPAGAIAGQIVGTLLPVALMPSSARIWRRARPALASRRLMIRMLTFGVGGTLALGIYILFNATSRNIVASFLGETEAGYLSLSCDLFIGPMALVGSAYSLSKLPSFYVVEAEGDPAKRRDAISGFVHMNLYFFIPYAIGAALLAPDIILAIMPPASRAEMAGFATGAAVQSAAMLMICTLTTIMLVFNLRRQLVATALGVSALNGVLLALALSGGAGLKTVVWISTLVLGAATLIVIWLGVARRLMRLEPGTLAKISLAALVMGGAVWLYNRVLLPGEPFGAALVGTVIYLALTALMGISYFGELVPARRRAGLKIAAIPGQPD